MPHKPTPPPDSMSALLAVLQQENGLLKQGRLHEAAGLQEQKITVLEQFDADLAAGAPRPAHRSILQRIVALSQENAAHFVAIRNGLKAAIARLENLQQAEASVGAYDRHGTRMAFQSHSVKLTKRL